MSTTQEKIFQTLKETFSPLQLSVTDDSEEHIGHAGALTGKGHYTVEISGQVFASLPLIQSHRMIYKALDQLMQTEIHALRIIIVRG